MQPATDEIRRPTRSHREMERREEWTLPDLGRLSPVPSGTGVGEEKEAT
jgi:hypothetical protein